MLSMTGYGSGSAPVGDGHVTVTARSVNHRYLDIRVKLAPELAELSDNVEAMARQLLGRGRIEISARVDRPPGTEVALSLGRAATAVKQLRALRDQTAPDQPIPLSLLSALPGLFAEGSAFTPDQLRDAVEDALKVALVALQRMRAVEGQALTRDLVQRVERIGSMVDEIETRAPDLIAQYRAKLHSRIAKLLADGTLVADPARLETEVALFADRADVTEEVTRLRAHCQHFLATAASSEAVGRKLDFLLQEMAREGNTIGSKIGDAAVTHIVVEIKTELERVREQVQNVL
jgi:uncharacterized protein (TIGR00255 family)